MTYLFLMRQSPYGGTLARESLDMALATAAFDQNVQLIFMGDGVYQLIKEQQSEIKHRKNMSKTLSALSLYDINEIYADENSVNIRGLKPNELFSDTKFISSETIKKLLQQADKVMSL